MASGSEPDTDQEAIRYKTIAESKLRSSNLKSALKHARKAHRLSPNTEGLSSMVTALEILNSAAVSGAGDSPDWYKVLQVEPFSHINTIKQRYRKLALVLHPDKNPYLGCEEAFKLVNEGFRVFSDRIRRKEYDMKVRIRIQEERVGAGDGVDDDETATFWTACSVCRLLLKFERKYLGHYLMCPNCKKSFEAKEVEKENEDRDGDENGACLRNKTSKIITYSRRRTSRGGSGGGGGVGSDSGAGLHKDSGEGDETLTLAQMQSEIKRNKAKIKSKTNERDNSGGENVERDELEKSAGDISASESPKILKERKNNEENEKQEASKKKKKNITDLTEIVDLEKGSRGDRKRSRSTKSQEDDMEIMLAEDSDFYDFDKDRTQWSFKKGQVWAIYNDGYDQMPRLYALIGDVVSLNPFKVFISWLDFENGWNEKLISWGKIGSHIPCGRFRVSKKTLINRLNVFSHVVDCERAAREVYRIYPKKGSVWVVYAEPNWGFERRNSRRYDIAVCLTLFSEIHGLSMAYLEKVDGYRNIFRRREFGCHAIKWLEKDDIAVLLSHQIPARKLPEDQSPDGLKDCWALDPASVPPDLVTTS